MVLHVSDLQALEVPCPEPNCKAKKPGAERKSRLATWCSTCDGNGFVVTPFGREVLEFVMRHLEVEVLNERIAIRRKS